MKITPLIVIGKVVRNTVIGSAIWILSCASAVACTGFFYVSWVEGEDVTDIYVRSVNLDALGVLDLYGQVSIPDEGVGVNNPSYMHTLVVNAFMNSTKLEIQTDGSDCVIDTEGKYLGVAEDIGAANINF